MSIYTGPEIEVSGLVFYYDMNNTQKSFIGMPMVNQFLLPEVDVNGFQVQNSTFTRVRSGTFGGYTIQPTDYVWRYNISVNDCPYHGNDVTITAGTTATFSFDYYVDPSTANYPITNYLANFEGVVGGSVADPTPATRGVWKRAVFSSTAGSTGVCRMLLYPGACGGRLGDSGFILYRNPQVQFNAPGNVPSPFVAGTRTDTQAILDLTGQNTVTASSLTYDNSNNSFSFNGSSNQIIFPENSALNTQTPTVEVWVRTNALSQNGFWFEKGQVNTQYALFQEGSVIQWRLGPLGDLSTTTASFMNTTNWFQVVGTFTSGDRRLYINGVQVNSNTTTGTLNTNANGCSIGVYGGFNGARGYYYNGSLAVVKVYNRALSAAEVNQNFQALRSRFGI